LMPAAATSSHVPTFLEQITSLRPRFTFHHISLLTSRLQAAFSSIGLRIGAELSPSEQAVLSHRFMPNSQFLPGKLIPQPRDVYVRSLNRPFFPAHISPYLARFQTRARCRCRCP
jgi:hypothetical protein